MRKKSVNYLIENDADNKYFKKLDSKINMEDLAEVMCDFQLTEIDSDCDKCPVKKYCEVGRSGFLSLAEE